MLQYVYPHGPVTYICPVAHNSHNTRLDSLMVLYVYILCMYSVYSMNVFYLYLKFDMPTMINR